MLVMLLVVGLCAGTNVIAADNFQITKLSTGAKDNIVPLQISTKLQVVAKNKTSDIVYTYVVDKPELASVTADGVLIPKKEGTVKVQVSARGKGTACDVVIKKASVSVTSARQEIFSNGDVEQMQAKLVFDGLDDSYSSSLNNEQIVWSVLNDNLASVDSQGKLTTKGKGTITVMATLKENTAFSGKTDIRSVSGYIKLSIPGSNEVTDISLSREPQMLAVASYVGKDDTVVWTGSGGEIRITDDNNENTPKHQYYVRLHFVDSGRITVRAALKSDPTVFSEYTFNVLPSYSELDDLVCSSLGYNMEDYTAQRWNNFQLALREAQAILDAQTASQKEINAAVELLRQRIKELMLPDEEGQLPPSAANTSASDTTSGTDTSSGDTMTESAEGDKTSSNDTSNTQSSKSTAARLWNDNGSFRWVIAVIAIVAVIGWGVVRESIGKRTTDRKEVIPEFAYEQRLDETSGRWEATDNTVNLEFTNEGTILHILARPYNPINPKDFLGITYVPFVPLDLTGTPVLSADVRLTGLEAGRPVQLLLRAYSGDHVMESSLHRGNFGEFGNIQLNLTGFVGIGAVDRIEICARPLENIELPEGTLTIKSLKTVTPTDAAI